MTLPPRRSRRCGSRSPGDVRSRGNAHGCIVAAARPASDTGLMAAPQMAARGAVVRATTALGLAHIVQLAASLANLWLLTRALGPAGYGELASVLATYVLLGALTDLGT